MQIEQQRVALSTGVELDVFTAGDAENPPVIFLHGFPESHRTWRHQMAALCDEFYCIAPNQRGYAGSGKPQNITDYTADKIAADLFALADALGISGFTLAGHDWGGAIVWMAAMQNPQRVEKLIVCNGPHPFIFQRSLFDDMAQREASQYMRTFRSGYIEQQICENGLEWFFDNSFMKYLSEDLLGLDGRAQYIAEWSHPGAMKAMLNWYRASAIIVPPMEGEVDEMPARPDYLNADFPKLSVPTLIVWGEKDRALLPCQIEGLEDVVDDVTITKVDAGHFVPWEAPEAVNAAITEWLN